MQPPLARTARRTQSVAAVQGKYPHFLVIEGQKPGHGPGDHGIQRIDPRAPRVCSKTAAAEFEGGHDALGSQLTNPRLLSQEAGSKPRQTLETAGEVEQRAGSRETYGTTANAEQACDERCVLELFQVGEREVASTAASGGGPDLWGVGHGIPAFASCVPAPNQGNSDPFWARTGWRKVARR